MGKIRVKTLGNEELEQEQSREARSRLARKKEDKKVGKAPGLKGGQRINIVGPTEEELAKLEQSPVTAIATPAYGVARNDKKSKPSKARARSKRYQAVKTQVDRTKRYSLTEALELLPKVHLAKFDETVELHVNTLEPLSGNITLPHGTGKKTRVTIANDDVIKEIEQGKIEFDVLLAEPDMMPKLAKVARILGPKGLMPNPKNGTITSDPKKAAAEFEKGLFNFKTEAKANVLHLTIGKLSFGDKKLIENIKTILSAVKKAMPDGRQEKIKSAVLKSTMSPGIKISVDSV